MGNNSVLWDTVTDHVHADDTGTEDTRRSLSRTRPTESVLGRPVIDIDPRQVECMREMGFKWRSIGDFLENYCEKDDLINAARLAFAVTIMLTYPVKCFVTREVLEHSVFAHYQPRTLWRHSLVTVIIVCLAMGFSMATDCLGVVLELNGVLAAAPLAFIIPPACVMKLQHEPVLCIKNIPMLLTTTFGIFVMGTGTAMVIKEMVNGYSCSHGEKLAYCQAENMTGLFTNQSVLTTTLRV